MKPFDLDKTYERYPEISRSEMKKFVQWINAQPHFSEISEQEALQFFHACHYSMETAKQVLDCNFTVRTHATEFFCNLDCESPEMKLAMKTTAICPLPKSTPEGYRVIVAKLSDTNASNFNFADVMKLYCMIFDTWTYEEGIEQGHIMVMDMKGCTLGHIARIGLLQMKKFLFYLQEAAAIRLVGLHFINIVPFMDKLLALMNPFMKKELKSMLFLHSDLNEFYKFVPKSILPTDYDGPETEMNTLKAIYYNRLKETRQDLLDFEKRHQVNEKLRPGKPKNASELFGIEGNFKKLDID